MKSRFSQLIVIGCGKIASEVLRYVAGLQSEYGYKLIFIEHEKHAMFRFEELCLHYNAKYKMITEKKVLTIWLSQIHEPTLIISAGNYYLFPLEIISKKDVEIINFHNALLPAYPGRNAQTWAIFMGEKVTGATWHYVTAEVDSGGIITQKKVSISDDVKAYELTKNIMDVAFELFTSFFALLLEQHMEGTPQPVCNGKRKIYYSHEIPNCGICNIKDNPEKIYRLLRSVDYGRNAIFPPIRIVITDDMEFQVARYAKKDNNHLYGDDYAIDWLNKRIYFPMQKKELEIRIK